MDKLIQSFAGIIITTITNVYIWSKLLNKRPNFKNWKNYLYFILMAITTFINYFYNNHFLRIMTITMMMSLFIKLIFNEKVNKSILGAVTSQLIYMISEIIFALIITFVFDMNSNDIINNQFGTVLANFVISSISIVVVNIKYVNVFYQFLIKITCKIKNTQIIAAAIFISIIANVLAMINYYKVEFVYLLIFNAFMTLGCFGIVVYSLKTKNSYVEVNNKYSTTLNSLKEYEDILNKYRVSNHENKNQLLTIRNMLPKEDKKIISYIDKILENKHKDSDKAMRKTAVIPAGGLRGLIYSKVLVMDERKIHYDLDFSSSIKTVDLINKIDESTMLDICTVIGVYVDNAIDEVTNLKDKNICIEMYLDDNDLIIAISNNYAHKIDLDKLEEKGYTTKENGHGYGLPLTREIINNNNRLKNEKRISKEIFTQVLKIKM